MTKPYACRVVLSCVAIVSNHEIHLYGVEKDPSAANTYDESRKNSRFWRLVQVVRVESSLVVVFFL